MKGFHLNGYTTGSHPEPQKLQLYTKFISPCESTPASIIQSGQTVGSLEDKILDPINNPLLLFDMGPFKTETERALMLS